MMSMPVLYIAATPIGNLGDLSPRAIKTLQKVDFILCEDTRVSQKLLNHFNIKTPRISYHQHSKINKINQIIELLNQGKDMALISDAGTPGISDPGNKLIKELISYSSRSYGIRDWVKIVSVPGPSALTAAASVAGLPMEKFVFLGFPPAKNKRNKFFQEIADLKYPVIIYESCHRIEKTLTELNSFIKQRQVVVCQELTKLHETIYRGTIDQVLDQLANSTIKGEFVIIIDKQK